MEAGWRSLPQSKMPALQIKLEIPDTNEQESDSLSPGYGHHSSTHQCEKTRTTEAAGGSYHPR